MRYSGYFDTTKCYAYAGGLFSPSSAVDGSNLCSGAWHGNFLNWATMTRMDILRKVLYGGYRSTDSATATVLERAPLPMDAHSFAKYYANASAPTPDRPNIDRITPFTVPSEITLCNTTPAPDGQKSQTLNTTTYPPLLRATSGNYSLWNAHERRQCRWDDERWPQSGSSNSNDPAQSGLQAQPNYPKRNGSNNTALPSGSNGDFIVRVEVCKTGMVGTERCRTYPSGNLKPIGLLQEYGENDLAEFGLVTGSYSNNIQGGVLRKNAQSFRNEMNATTDGTFIGGVKGIVWTLDHLKVYGYDYGDGTYLSDGNCTFQLTSLTNGGCTSWGNPIGEMFIEVLRYLRGLAPSPTYGGGADAKGAEMNLTVSTWVDPFTRGNAIDSVYGAPQCRPINDVNFNASVTSYDADTTGPFTNLGATGSLASYTDAIGVGEGITGSSRFVGETLNNTSLDKLCTAKQIGNLSDVRGICSLGPAYKGSFSLAGAAYWANTNPIRQLPAGLTGLDAQRAYRVRTYSVALAPGVPRITVKTPDGLRAVIQPAYRLDKGGGNVGSGTLVDFRVVSQTATSGNYLLVWEDSEQGGDYDSDVIGTLSWSLTGTNTMQVTTRVNAQSTVNPQGFGYTISGTTKDGVHFHSGILGFNFTDPTGSPGCSNCQAGGTATSATYTLNGASGNTIEDPMWYAAKWGGFRNPQGVAIGAPTTTSEWDSINNATGAAGADGIPDNYSEVFNPDQLEASLRRVFNSTLTSSNAAPAVSSAQLLADQFRYVASFDTTKQIGDVEAFPLDTNGNFGATAVWRFGALLTATPLAGRQVISNDGATGFPFTSSEIAPGARASYLGLLTGGTRTLTTAQAQDTVNFIRGDRSKEGTVFKARDQNNILGPIVNASPWLEDRPSARFLDSSNPGYAAFATARASRPKILWAAADDGMLHAMNARTGAPIMSYVPEALAPRLGELTATSPDIQPFVDGSPFSGDVDLNAGVSGRTGTSDWRTFVFGTLGRGGSGIFALDGTDPNVLAAAEANAASIFRWQFTANDDVDMGHILSDVAIEPGTGQASPIVQLQDGRYAVVFGNGYQSKDGKAALFVLPVQGPDNNGNWAGRYYKIVVDVGPNNGLSTPTLLDSNNDGKADTVYAGDLKGNLWKFDLSSLRPAEWKSAYLETNGTTPKPLYVATAGDNSIRLPITAAPQFSFPTFGGVVVTFATGLSVLPSDFPNTRTTQRVYGIWDRPAFASSARSFPRGTTTLVPRTLARAANGQISVTDAASIDFLNADAAAARDGWYFDLPSASEMVLSNFEYRANNISFTSIRPPPASAACEKTPAASFYLFDPILGFSNSTVLNTTTTGTPTTGIVIGTDVADQKVRVVNDATRRTLAGATATDARTAACPDGSAALRVIGRSTDQSLCFRQANARFQWREVPGMRTK